MFVGKDFTPAVISKINQDSPAEKAGLMVNDQIIKIEGNKIISINDVSQIINISTADTINVTIERNGIQKSFLITPKYIKDESLLGSKRNNSKRRIIGINISPLNNELNIKKLGPAKAIFYAVSDTIFLCKYILIHIGKLLTFNADISSLSGPVGIAQISGELIKLGILPFILLMAHISISLGLVNLLPIPVLDGGHIMFFCFEKILGRPVKEKLKNFYFESDLQF